MIMKKVFTLLFLLSGYILIAQPTTLQIPVSSSADDAEECVEDNLWVNPGDMLLDNSELEMVYDDNVLRLCHVKVGLRFVNVTIPQGATIYNAYVQFTCKQVSTDVVNLTVNGQNSNNPAPFTDASGNISARPLTSASVNWVPMGWYTEDEAGTDQRTPSLVPVIQEIVNRSGWVSGNALALIVSGSGDSRAAYAYDGDPAKSAVLYVQYSGVGMNENNLLESSVIWPVPASSQLNLSMPAFLDQDTEFRIYNQLGAEQQNLYWVHNGAGQYSFDISSLSAGFYFLNIRTSSSAATLRFTIQ